MNKLFKVFYGMLLLAYPFANSLAQPVLLAPTQPDQLWVTTSTAVINGINTALIDYPIYQQSYGQLGACAHGATIPSATRYNGVVVTDFTTGTTVNVPYPAGLFNMASVPDVILGNNIQALDPTRSFIMAVAFVNNNIPAQIQIDYFDINYAVIPGPFTVTYNSSQYFSTPFPYNTPLGTVHLDVVAQSNTPVFGRPLCDKFFLTFDAGLGAHNVYGAYGSLSAYSTLVGPTLVAASFHPADIWQPDVAGVELKDTTGAPGGRVTGIFTFVNQCNCALYVMAWDPLSGGVSGVSYTAPGGPGVDPYSNPRIDANDDINSNSSAFNSNYKVVVEHLISGIVECETFDNLATYNIVSAPWVPSISSNGFYRPAIAYGQPGPFSSEYMLTEVAEDASIAPPFRVIMQPVFESDPLNVAWEPSLFNQYNFQVNNTGGSGAGADMVPTLYTNAVSTACNRVFDTSLVAWADFDGTNFNVWYKRSGYDWAGNGYAYRGAQTQESATAPGLYLWPNPTATQLFCAQAGSYIITDMLGRQVMQGSLAAKSAAIDVSSLPPAVYSFSLSNGAKVQKVQFVKQ